MDERAVKVNELHTIYNALRLDKLHRK